MKKISKILTIFVVSISLLSLFGCESKKNTKKHEDKDDEIKTKVVDSVLKVDKIEQNLKNDSIVVYKLYVNSKEEYYAIIEGYDKDNKLKWTYETEPVEYLRSISYSFLKGYDDKIFLQDVEDIIVIDVETGKEKTRIKNVDKRMVFVEIDDNNIYFAQTTENEEYLDSKIIGYDKETLNKKVEMTVPEKYKDYDFSIDSENGKTILNFTNIEDGVVGDNYTVEFKEDKLKAFGFKIEKFN